MSDVLYSTVHAVLRKFITVDCREGETGVMYLDRHDPPLVTTGCGNLIDPKPAALKLPWRFRRTKLPAGPDAVSAEWELVKADVAHSNYRLSYWEARAVLELAPETISKLFEDTVQTFQDGLARDFKDLGRRTADEQLGLMGMAWGLGPRFRAAGKYPRFCAAWDARDFAGMVRECSIKNPYHDLHDRVCFNNAAVVVARGMDPKLLRWPTDLSREGATA